MAKTKPQIDRDFLRRFVSSLEEENLMPLNDDDIDQFAATYLDGKTRAEQETAFIGPWFEFLASRLESATASLKAKVAARNPSAN